MARIEEPPRHPYGAAVGNLIERLATLPGIGRKSAERLFRSRRVDIVRLSTTEDYLLPLRAFFEQRAVSRPDEPSARWQGQRP